MRRVRNFMAGSNEMMRDVNGDESGSHERQRGDDRVFRAESHSADSVTTGAAAAQAGAEADEQSCD